jgi:hypothetical protein
LVARSWRESPPLVEPAGTIRAVDDRPRERDLILEVAAGVIGDELLREPCVLSGGLHMRAVIAEETEDLFVVDLDTDRTEEFSSLDDDPDFEIVLEKLEFWTHLDPP